MCSLDVRLPASLLYVPADDARKLASAAKTDAGALILDLEDGVPPHRKELARANLGSHLEALHAAGAPRAWVRVSTAHIDQDWPAVDPELVEGVVAAKSEPASLARLVETVGDEVPVIALIESARGLRGLDAMAALDSVVTFGMGEVDLLADLRISRTRAPAAALAALRVELVAAAAAAQLQAPVAPTSVDVRDLDRLAETTEELFDCGFRSRTAIHPRQCAIINRVAAPSAADITAAHAVLDAFERADGGVALDDDGRLIDAAVVRAAREVVERPSASKETH
ncbi:CoA ester lyase [uncultured Aeromicrobium sp.]|uniref:HpcH/HpaI aldolase/citrate lyase family protein n=1 Tax=uncultured Aeromicrobium sp. TaxID=337820 RepID=UPI0025F57EF7|nr:aldolase/citrate lyase family protein [uncultured Aeromicrobium sp.]